MKYSHTRIWIQILILFWNEDNARNIFYLKKELKVFLQDNFKLEIDICSEKWIKQVFRDLILKEGIYAGYRQSHCAVNFRIG